MRSEAQGAAAKTGGSSEETMRIQDQAPNGATAGQASQKPGPVTGAEKAEGSRAGSAGGAGGGTADRVSLSSLASTLNLASGQDELRQAEVERLAEVYERGELSFNAEAIAAGMIEEGLSEGEVDGQG